MIETIRLTNGATLVWIQAPLTRTIEMHLQIKCGRDHEKSGQSGISHFVEHMAFRHDIEDTTLHNWAHNKGFNINAKTEYGYVRYSLTGRIANALDMIQATSIISNSLDFNEDDVHIEKSVILAERNELMGSYDYILQGVLRQLHYKLEEPDVVIGSEIDIVCTSADDLKLHKQQNYTSNNATLFIVGDMHSANRDCIQNTALEMLNGMRLGRTNNCSKSVNVPVVGGDIQHVDTGRNVTDVVLEWELHNEDIMECNIIASLLHKELFHDIRCMQGKCYDIRSSASAMLGDNRKLRIEFSSSPIDVDDIMHDVVQHIRTLVTTIDQDSIDAELRLQHLAFDEMLDNRDKFVDAVMSMDVEGVKLNDLLNSIDRLELKPSDLKESYRRIFNAPYSIIVLGESNLGV